MTRKAEYMSNPQHTTVHVTRRLETPIKRRGTREPWTWEIGYVEAVVWKPDGDPVAAEDWRRLTEVRDERLGD